MTISAGGGGAKREGVGGRLVSNEVVVVGVREDRRR